MIFFPDFCQLVLERLREDKYAEEDFRRFMFKVMDMMMMMMILLLSMLQMLCGTEPHPKDIRAKKYRVDKHFLTKEDFVHIMKNLPVPVDDEDIEEMFEFADKNKDGKLSYKEFKVIHIMQSY